MSENELLIESLNNEINKINAEFTFIDIPEEPDNLRLNKKNIIIEQKNRKGVLI